MMALSPRRLRTAALVLGTTAAVSLATAVAEASVPDAAGEIHACYTTASTALRPFFLIDSARTTHCPAGFTAITLNQTGPRGPAGPAGPPGPAALSTFDPPDQTFSQANEVVDSFTVMNGGFYYIAGTASVRLLSGRCSDTVADVSWDSDVPTQEVTAAAGEMTQTHLDGQLVYLDPGTHTITVRWSFWTRGGGQNCGTGPNSAEATGMHFSVVPM